MADLLQISPDTQGSAPRALGGKDSTGVDALLLDIDGYEGPIDILLELARTQKVDLKKISILQLSRQYLSFIERATDMNLKLAAEYLVMAAWLAYLKSRLLLPEDEDDNEVSAEAMAEALQFQLRRLEAMQNAAAQLLERPRLGKDIFARGMPETVNVKTHVKWHVQLYDVLKAYGNIRERSDEIPYELPDFTLMSTDTALSRMIHMFGELPKKGLSTVWTTLDSFIPKGVKDRLYGRSSIASSLTAGLELAKQGKVEFKQDGLFRPIYMRALDDLSDVRIDTGKNDAEEGNDNTPEDKEETTQDEEHTHDR